MGPPSWAWRTDEWWARVAAVATVITGVVATLAIDRHNALIEIAGATVVVVSGYLVRARWPTMPTVLLLVWTLLPPIIVNLRGDAEGTMFMIIIGLSYATLIQPDRRVRVAYAIAGVALPAFIGLFAYTDWGWPYWTLGILFGCLSSSQMRHYRLLVRELEGARERLAEQAVDAERRRLATEVHDLVGHSLTVVLLYLTGARRRVRVDPGGAEHALIEAEEIGRRCLAEIRQSVAVLRGDGPGSGTAPTPTARDVPLLVASAVSAGSDVHLTIDGELDDVEPIVGLAVYRVVQECLVNATNHAAGASVAVTVAVAPERVTVAVDDTGGGSTGDGKPGVGLVGMRERVESLGGTFTAGPIGPGWAVHACLPRRNSTEQRPP
jgi:signal transduction histidine kinase